MDLYLRMRKVEPLDRMFEQLQVHGWASGVRGNQTDHRRAMRPLDSVRGRWSLRPLLSWTSRDVFYYMQDQALPHHPLFEQGYSTVGDWHSSGPDAGSDPGEDGQREDGQRGSRFAGLRQECGNPPAWRDGRGHLRWACRGPAPPARWLLIGNSRWHWAEAAASATSGLRCWHSQAPASLKPKGGRAAALLGLCGTARTPAPVTARAPLSPGRRAAGLDAALARR